MGITAITFIFTALTTELFATATVTTILETATRIAEVAAALPFTSSTEATAVASDFLAAVVSCFFTSISATVEAGLTSFTLSLAGVFAASSAEEFFACRKALSTSFSGIVVCYSPGSSETVFEA
jgi:hypothetical protein